MKFLRKLRALFRKEKIDADMAEEMRAHLELQTVENEKRGMSSDEARYAARRAFGGVEQVKEIARAQRGGVGLEQFASDVRFALRSLLRARAFSATVSGTLALGIGVATLVFNLTAGQLFYDPPYPNPAELVAIGSRDEGGAFDPDISMLHWRTYQEQAAAFTEYVAIEGTIANGAVDGEPGPLNHVRISQDGFRMLGIRPMLGRGFLPEEYREGADNVVVITDYVWRTRFNADSAVLGREMLIDRRPCKVIGVLRRGPIPFRFQGDVYQPLLIPTRPTSGFGPGIHVVARLRAGVTPELASQTLGAVRFPAGLPPWVADLVAKEKPVVVPLKQTASSARWWVMFAGGVFLFAIACLNAMNLMLVRLLDRGRELSVRLAIGGTRWQIARLVLLESVALALAAGAVVMLAAHWWFPPLFKLILDSPRAQFGVFADAVTTVSVCSMSLVAVLGVVLVLIYQLRNLGVMNGLKTGGAHDIRKLGAVRNSLVMLQSGLAVLLLAGTGLMMRSFQKVHEVDLGFDPAGMVKVVVSFARGFEPKEETRLQYFERLRERVAAIPGVQSASFGSDALLIGVFSGVSQLVMDDGTFRAMAETHVAANTAETAGLRLKRGRWLSDREGDREVVLNETAARARFGDEDPIGQMIRVKHTGQRTYQVVGVVGDVRENVRSPAGLRLYFPNWMAPGHVSTLTLRLKAEPEKEFAGVLRRAIYDFDPALITTYVTSIRGALDGSMGAERFTYMILRGLAAVAFVLAGVGLFSVIAYTVNTRTREFGVRLALGAQPANLHRLVLQRGLATAAGGVALGTLGALGLTRFLESMLFEISPYDPGVYLCVAFALLAAAALACWLPARRAAKVDPAVALRSE